MIGTTMAAIEIARELDRKCLLRSSEPHRSLSDYELREVSDVIEAMLPTRQFAVHWTYDLHLTSDRHSRGGPGAHETTVLAVDKDSARNVFYAKYPSATVMTIEEQ